MIHPSGQKILDAGCAIYFDLFIGKAFPLVSSSLSDLGFGASLFAELI